MEWIEYGAWGRCVRLANAEVELVVTSELGPRIIRFGFVGEANEFAEFPEQRREDPNEWHIYGGHRLWHAPEAKPRSYAPDNAPVEIEARGGTVLASAPVEASTGIQKAIHLSLAANGPAASIVHLLTNRGLWEVTLAPWALSVMRTGGVAVVPQPAEEPGEGLLPNRALALWPYTDMRDARLNWGRHYIRMHQDPGVAQPVKFGLTASGGWTAYVNDGHAFMKSYAYRREAAYPDYGVCVECYTAADFLELETLGPLQCLAPGETAEYAEEWLLIREVDASSEAQIGATLAPHARQAVERICWASGRRADVRDGGGLLRVGSVAGGRGVRGGFAGGDLPRLLRGYGRGLGPGAGGRLWSRPEGGGERAGGGAGAAGRVL
jgi:hypothetical protein